MPDLKDGPSTTIEEQMLGDGLQMTYKKINSSTKISKEASNIITHFSSEPPPSTPLIIRLTADASVANKLVSIVEIAKRQVFQNGHRMFQYSALTSRLVEEKTKTQSESKDAEEDAFEPVKQGDKERIIPTMTVYICTSSVKRLKDAYGEQTT